MAYSFSKEPFDKKNGYYKKYKVDWMKLPLLLKFHQHLFGNKLPNKLVLLRTSGIYESRADELIFTRDLPGEH